MSFPGSIDSIPLPSATSPTNNPGAAEVSVLQSNAIVAVENKLGTGASTPIANKVLRGTGTGTSAYGSVALTTDVTGTLPVANGGTGATASTGTGNIVLATSPTITTPRINTPTITNASITADAVSGYTTAGSGTIYGLGVAAGAITTSGYASSTALQTNAVQANQLATSAILLGYAQTTSTFSTSSISYVQVTGLTTTVTIPAGSRKTKITVFFSKVQNTNANTGQYISIWDGIVGSGTQLQELEIDITSATFQVGGTLVAVVSPSAGSKTYNVGAKTTTATGGANFEAAATYPAFILVEAI